MGQDVSAEVAAEIGSSKVFGASENIRHGKYSMLIKRCFSDKIAGEKGDHRWSFIECVPLASEPNPQTEGDHVDYPLSAGPLRDDGRTPNAVGAPCALKVDHDGAGGRSAGSNVKAAILAVFNAQEGQISDEEINKTWIDMARRKPCKKGDIIGFDPKVNQPITAVDDKIDNPMCGVIVNCTTIPKRKKTANDKGAFITKLIWSCASPLGTGVNTKELIAQRRAEILANTSWDDDEEDTTSTPAAPPSAPGQAATSSAPAIPPAPPAPPVPPAPPATTAAPFVPPVPWTKHTSAPWGATPDKQWYFSDPTKGGNNAVKSAAQLMAGQ